MKEGIGHESLERVKPLREETNPEGSQKKKKTSTDGHPVPPAKTLTMGAEQQSTKLTVTKVSEAPIIGSSEKLPSLESEITNPAIDKATSTPSSEQEKAVLSISEKLPGSESEIAPIDKTPETRNSESEHTPNSEGKKGSESKGVILHGEERKKSEVLQMEKDSETPKGTQGSDPKDTERPSDAEKGKNPGDSNGDLTSVHRAISRSSGRYRDRKHGRTKSVDHIHSRSRQHDSLIWRLFVS